MQWLPEEEQARVQRVEAVDVLRRIDGARDLGLVHMRGQRELHEDPVHSVVRVQLLEQVEDLALLGRLGKAVVARVDPGLGGRLVLPADVDVRRRIVADEDGGEADGLAKSCDFFGDFRAHFLRVHRRGREPAEAEAEPEHNRGRGGPLDQRPPGRGARASGR